MVRRFAILICVLLAACGRQDGLTADECEEFEPCVVPSSAPGVSPSTCGGCKRGFCTIVPGDCSTPICIENKDCGRICNEYCVQNLSGECPARMGCDH